MTNLIQDIGLISGCLLLGAICIGLIAYFIYKAAEFYQAKNDERCKEYVLGQLASHSRWCAHDFPQVTDICEQIEIDIRNGWRTGNQDYFREYMRKKYSVKST